MNIVSKLIKYIQVDRENKVGETPLTIVCGGVGGDPSNGTCFEAAKLLSKRGADVLAHSSLLTTAFGEARATELIETAADLPPTSVALTENLRRILDEASVNDNLEGKYRTSFKLIHFSLFYLLCINFSLSIKHVF